MRMVAFVKAEPSEQPVTDAKMNATQASFICSPRKSTGQAAQQLQMPKLAVQKILWLHLIFKSYTYKPTVATCNNQRQRNLWNVLTKHEENELFIGRIALSNAATFPLSRYINPQNIKIWECNKLHAVNESEGPCLLCYAQTECFWALPSQKHCDQCSVRTYIGVFNHANFGKTES